MSRVSFGALAKAQDALSQQQTGSHKRKRGDETARSKEDALQALRERLQEIKAAKLAQAGNLSRMSKSKLGEDEENSNDSDSDDAPQARSSKHAPAVQSSKRAVSRKRQVIDVKKPLSRDPRFDSVSGPKVDENTLKKRYAFLDDYKASEMAELRDAIKKTKNEGDKERLKKKLMSMESQQKTQQAKDKRQDILRGHKKQEKELIKQGKKPFFLKKCEYSMALVKSQSYSWLTPFLAEQKKLALVDRFQNMKSKDRDRAIERRRKKVTARERRNMPAERRAA